MHKPQVVLTNWFVVAGGGMDVYKAPETVRSCLAGDVVGHPDFDDGHHVTTSPIVGPVSVRDGRIIETANTLYLLDGPHPKYKEWCSTNSYEVVS